MNEKRLPRHGTVFEVEIANNGPKGNETAITLEMPATWSEFHDALEKARIEDGHSCSNELIQIKREGFPQSAIGRNVNLYELNLLARRLTMLTEEQDCCFDGLLKMEQRKKSGPIPLRRLINFTFNTDSCCVAYHVCNDQELGKFLYENDMLPDEAAPLLDAAEPDSEYLNSLLALLGKKHREDEGGVFTNRGYVEADGSFLEVYVPGEMAYFDRSGAPVVLEVSKGFFNDPAYDNDLTAVLDLPASDACIWQAALAVKAASPKECAYRCTECIFPAARELIDAAIDDEGDIGSANEFARLLEEKKRQWSQADRTKYKALLEASGCTDLRDAIQLLHDVENYEFHPEIAQPWDYAEVVLKERYPGLPTVLFQTRRSHQAGVEMLEQDHAVLTSYGVIRRKDGAPLPELGLTNQGPALDMM